MNLFWQNTFRFIIVLLIQIFILNNIYLHNFIVPVLYLFFVIKLPFTTPKVVSVLLAFLMGITIDLFSGTPGINAAATTAVAFLRPSIIKIILPKINKDSGLSPSISDIGFLNFSGYSLSMIFVHCIFLMLLDVFSFQDFGQTCLRIITSTAISLLIIVLFEMLSKLILKTKKQS